MSDETTRIINSETDIFKKLSEPWHCIEIFFQGKEYRYERAELPICFGRNGDECEFTVDSTTASRKHCSIDVRENQIGIQDTSTNGTYIKIGRAESVLIKNSFFPLVSQGNISLGEPIDMGSENIIYFRVSADRAKTPKK